MASFQSRIGRKRMRKGENKNYRFVPFLPDALKKIPKKNCKKIKKKTIMASFQARIGWKRLRKKENNYCRTVPFLPNA